MNQAQVIRFPPRGKVLTAREVEQYAECSYEEALRYCKQYGFQRGGRPQSPYAIHMDTLEAVMRKPREYEEIGQKRMAKRIEATTKARRANRR